MFPDGTQKVVADLADSDLAPVLDGVHAVFLLTGGLNIAAHDRRLVAAARLGSVERIVKLSVLAVGHGATTRSPPCTGPARRRSATAASDGRSCGHRVHVQRAQLGADDRRRSGRAPPVRRWPRRRRRPGGHRSGRRGLPHRDGHDDRVYELTGPEPLSPADQVAILSQVLDRDLRYAESDPADMLAQMVSYGMPEELAHAVIEQLRSTLKPFNSEPTGDITAVTSRPARSFTDWAQAHRTELLTPASW